MVDNKAREDVFMKLLENVNESIPIITTNEVQNDFTLTEEDVDCIYQIKILETNDATWGKTLEYLPSFTIKEIEEHRLQSGKTPGSAIIKTLDRGRKFKEERSITATSIYTKLDGDNFVVTGQCKASMKKEKRNIVVHLHRRTGKVVKGDCSCPAGKSSYCNHIMALLLELADYSLNQLKTVPEEVACTSRGRQWGVPGEASVKAAVMDTTVQKSTSKRGISSTLYDPRRGDQQSCDFESTKKLKTDLASKNRNIGFLCSVPNSVLENETINTRYGQFLVGSPLSFHLNPVGFSTNILTNITKIEMPNYTIHQFQKLPLYFINEKHAIIPKWDLSQEELWYTKQIQVTRESCRELEKDTTLQADSNLWHYSRKYKITSSTAHKIFIRKKNFQSLVDTILSPKPNNELPYSIQESIKHGKIYEPIAGEKYTDILKYHLNRDISVRETGILIQPNLFWLAASPDGLISDKSVESGSHFGLVEIKCPKSKKNYPINDLIKDESFYIQQQNGKLFLRKDHPDGYFTQIQMTMGLCGATFCDFIVYTFDGLIIIRTPFEEKFFLELVKKLNMFYKDFMLPKILVIKAGEEEPETIMSGMLK